MQGRGQRHWVLKEDLLNELEQNWIVGAHCASIKGKIISEKVQLQVHKANI